MKLIAPVLVAVSLVGCKPRKASNASEVLTYGPDAQEAILELDGYYLAPPKAGNFSAADDIETLDPKTKDTLEYLFGIFQFQGVFKENPAIPFGNPEWTTTPTSETVEFEGKTMRKIQYHLKDRTLVRKTLFSDPTKPKTMELRLPLDVNTFYNLGIVETTQPDGTKKFSKPCTDPHYDGKGDFWYFWDPDKEGCPPELKEKGTVAFQATFTPLPNTTQTFPEYGRLGTPQLLSVYVAIGANAGPLDIATDPEKMSAEDKEKFEKDAGTESYRAFLDRMATAMKYEVKPESHRRALLTSSIGGRTIEVHVGLFKTSPREKTPAMKAEFEQFMRDAFEKADVIIYNGHSGLGGSLPPKRFFGAMGTDGSGTLPTKYQIAFFNGCSTYAYYRDPYFQRKGGTKNLDVISTGLESWFSLQPVVSSNLIFYLAQQQQSWQAILNNFLDATRQKGYDVTKYSAHFSVNGDEDNPTTLQGALNAKNP